MTITLNPQIIGRAEHAHEPVLDRVLAGTGLTRPGWIALTLAGTASGSTSGAAPSPAVDLDVRVADALKIDRSAADDTVRSLVVSGLLDPRRPGNPRTASGEAVFGQVRAMIDRVLAEVYGDIPVDDLAAAARVLLVITDRLNALTREA